MYSPKISEKLIPVLYREARSRNIPMTRLVNELLTQALAGEFAYASAWDNPEFDGHFCVAETNPQEQEVRDDNTERTP